ncbi:MAG: hypothetical protein Fur0012_04680 [Elusimicrobiota bacterium]
MGKEKIRFFNRTRINLKPFFPSARKLAKRILSRFKGEACFIFVSAEEIKKLNGKYFSKNSLTDVITFNLPLLHSREIGEVYICVPKAEKQARKYGHHLYSELLILTAHGCLHLLGHEDYTPALRKAMNIKTVRLLKK